MHDAQPDSIDVRENRAVVNAARLRAGVPVDVDTPADVLRLAVALCGDDVSLVTPSRLRGLPRGQRRALLAALDEVIGDNPAKLADVRRHQEPFKRLGERLHPHEHPRWPAAQDAFAVARGELEARTLAGRCELALAEGDPGRAIEILSNAPGMLLRAVDRLARSGADPARLAEAVREAAPAASTRVLLSLREHLLNRDAPAAARMFVNQRGRPWVGADERPPLDAEMAAALAETLDAEVAARLPRIERLVVDPAARSVAVPRSGKGADGRPRHPAARLHDARPRSRALLRVLEAARAPHRLRPLGEPARRALRAGRAGLVDQPRGRRRRALRRPHRGAGGRERVHRHRPREPFRALRAGEGFDRAEEAFFGYMQRTPGQAGRPFEPRAVRAKSDLYGPGRTSLPLLFARDDAGAWAGAARTRRARDLPRPRLP